MFTPLRKTSFALVLSVLCFTCFVSPAIAADPLTVIAEPSNPFAGEIVTFTFNPKVIDVNDIIDFEFGDGGKGKIEYSVGCGMTGGCDSITHAYAGSGTYLVTAKGKLSGKDVEGAVNLVVKPNLEEADLYIPTAAHSGGYLGSDWRTDVDVHNPGLKAVTFDIAFLPAGQSNTKPLTVTYTLSSKMSAHYGDIISTIFKERGNAALRITPKNGVLIATSRTYNQLAQGTYGQLVPSLPRSKALVFGQQGVMIGLSHTSAISSGVGYRTNIGFVNASPAPIVVEARFWTKRGNFLGTVTYDLKAYEFFQKNRAFEDVTPDPVEYGFVVVRARTAGAKFFAYAAVVDNATGDPVYLPASLIE